MDTDARRRHNHQPHAVMRRKTGPECAIELTVNDPKAYTAPFTVKLNHFLMADTELVDYICQDNEKSLQHFVTK